MNFSTLKSIPWMMGFVAALALVGIIAGAILLNPSSQNSPTDAPALVDYTAPAQGVGYESAAEPALPGNSTVATYTRFPQVRLSRESRADLVDSETLAANSNRVIAQQDAAAAAPTAVAIAPTEDWNPIFSQHTFTVTVNGADGAPANGVEVEVFLNRFADAVGDIVSLAGENPRKVDNSFGRVITDANGQAMLTITATRPGDTDVTAFVPQIADDNAHKVFAVKHWVDMTVEFPGDAVNLVGTDHPMLVRITKVSDGSPIADVDVSWAIIDNDPAASIGGAENSIATKTDANGETSVVLQQAAPVIGDNQVLIQVLEAGSGKTMFGHTLTKQWQSPALDVDKQGPANLGLQKTAEYTVSITNSGDTTATNVTLTDDLPAGLTFVSSEPAASSAAGSNVTWGLGDIAPGETVSVTMMLTATTVGEQVNTATAVSVEGITGQGTSVTDVIPGSLALSKTAPEQTILGDELTYEITVTNDGEGALTSVVLTDTLPATLTYVTSEPAGTAAADGTVTWTLDNLEAGASRTISVVATSGEPGEVVNAASAASAEGASAEAEVTTLVTKSDLAITKSADNESPLLGEATTFTIQVTNNGNATASDVVVVDAVPTGFGQVTATPEGSLGTDGSLQWTLASLAAGATETITVSGTAAAGGTHTNVVTATERGVTVSAEASVNVLVPAVSLTKTGGAAMYIDGERTYTITATNTGTANLTGVTITDNVPAELAYVSSDSDGVAAEGVVTWDIGNLDVGQAADVTVTLRGVSVGEVVNTATVTSTEGATADASQDISIVAAAAAHLSIIDSVDPMGVGETGSYVVAVINQSSDSAMTNVRLTVAIPSEFTVVAAEGGEISGNTVTYAIIASLGAGQEQQFTVEVEAVAAGDVVASATLQYDEFGQAITAQEGTTIVSR